MYSQHSGVLEHDFHHTLSESTTATHEGIEGHQTSGTSLIGRPILFISGQFAGQTIRAELHEVQKADLGRKYARVDRRPLDPPPVVQLRLFHVFNAGTDQATEKEVGDYDEVQVLGFLCTVDLFPAPSPESSRKHSTNMLKSQSAPPTQSTFVPTMSSQFHPYPKQQAYAFINQLYPVSQMNATTAPALPLHVPPHPVPSYLPPHSASDILQYVGDYPITENSRLTQALVGATFVQPACVDYQGKKSLMFVFADLAVKIEGTFFIRYRAFDIFSKSHNCTDQPIQAECYGGIFRVYSTKEFPGLQASTPLTKQLALWGVRLNIRETERKRRKKGDTRSVSPSHSGPGKRKHLSFADRDPADSDHD